MPSALEYDYIVVGGGAGGCVVAGRLAESGHAVLLLEAGPRDLSPVLRIPGAAAFAGAKRFNWNYETEPQSELEGRRLFLSQGRVLGGGASINGMVYSRGFPQDYDAWRAAGCDGWGFEDVLPYFRYSEANERGADEWHGGGGPLRITKGRSSLPVCGPILEAASQAGFPIVDDFCRPFAEGFGFYDFMISEGRRSSASAAFLKGPGASKVTVLTRATAHRLQIEGGRTVGVAFERNGELITARARGEVVLASGAINTPKLLMLSGIGPADPLRSLGLPVLIDQPQVGRHLQNHLCLKLAFATRDPITAYRYLSPLTGALEFGRYLVNRSGYLAEGLAPVGGFFNSRAPGEHADLQMFATPAVVGLLGAGIRALLPSEHGFTFFLSHGCPASRGTVSLRSADPADAPCIDPCYLTEPSDLERLIDGTERLREIAGQPALAKVITHEIRPGAQVTGRAAIGASIRRLATNQFHVAGTCRMGRSGSESVVDTELRVHGIEGLRIADASIMPQLMNGNTTAPVVMIAERAAAFIREGGGRRALG